MNTRGPCHPHPHPPGIVKGRSLYTYGYLKAQRAGLNEARKKARAGQDMQDPATPLSRDPAAGGGCARLSFFLFFSWKRFPSIFLWSAPEAPKSKKTKGSPRNTRSTGSEAFLFLGTCRRLTNQLVQDNKYMLFIKHELSC
jgi:hypothetical protein